MSSSSNNNNKILLKQTNYAMCILFNSNKPKWSLIHFRCTALLSELIACKDNRGCSLFLQQDDGFYCTNELYVH
jgi:hypothetical protein